MKRPNTRLPIALTVCAMIFLVSCDPEAGPSRPREEDAVSASVSGPISDEEQTGPVLIKLGYSGESIPRPGPRKEVCPPSSK